MFLLSEQEFDEMFNEGIGAFAYGSPIGIYKNTLDRLDKNKIELRTESIDDKMEKKGFKPLKNPSEEQIRTLIWGKNSKKEGENATKSNLFNGFGFQKFGTIDIKGRKYIYFKISSIVHGSKKDFDKGNIGAVYPIYINDKGDLRLNTIMISNKYLT